MKLPVNIVCVKTGKKYSNKNLEQLYKMVECNCTLPFTFYCLTDNLLDLPKNVVGVGLNESLDLDSYWWKICLFNLGWNEHILYFDLDIIIQNNFDYIFEDIDDRKIKCLNISDAGIYYPFDGSKNNIMAIPQTFLNSSIMLFKPINFAKLYDKFISNIDYNIVHYYGLDRFISHNTVDISFFDFKKDYYYRAKGQESYDKRFRTENGFIHDPRKTFCIMNQCNEEHYKGMEEYLL